MLETVSSGIMSTGEEGGVGSASDDSRLFFTGFGLASTVAGGL